MSHQRTLQSKDGSGARLLQWLHATPPAPPPEAVGLSGLHVEPPAEKRGVLPALALRLVRTLLQENTSRGFSSVLDNKCNKPFIMYVFTEFTPLFLSIFIFVYTSILTSGKH